MELTSGAKATTGLVGEALELVIALGAEATLLLLRAGLQVSELRQEVLSVVSLVQLGLIRRGHRLVGDALPINLLEPWVRLDLLSIGWSATETRVRVLVQQLDAEVSGIL